MRANRAIAIAVFLALLLVGFFGAVVVRYGRRLDAAVAAEVERLAEMAITDPLTGLRNHRAFHEDVARELQRVGRTGVPLALVLLDLDDLKAVNDSHGHQAGDERLQALADAIRATGRSADLAYRVGGDEFAVILPDARSWGALEFAQRLRARRRRPTASPSPRRSPSADLRAATSSIRDADLALIGAKRIHQDVVVFSPDLAPGADADGDEHHMRTLATALARAVDAKDSIRAATARPSRSSARDRRRARLRRRAARADAPGRPAARRRQDRRPRRDPQQAREAHRRRVRADEAPFAARLRIVAVGRAAGRRAGYATTTSASTAAAIRMASRARRSRWSRGSSSSPTPSRR